MTKKNHNQPELPLLIEGVRPKVKSRRKEDLQYEYNRQIFHSSLEQMAKAFNTQSPKKK